LEFKTDTRLSDFDFRFACRKSISHYYPRTRLYGYATFGLAFLTYTGSVYLNNVTDSGDYYYLVLVGMAAIVAYIAHVKLRFRKIFSSLQIGRLRDGTTTVTLNDGGYHSEKPGYRVSISWGHFDDAIETREGLLLLFCVSEFLIIPKSSISNDVMRSELLEQIKAWIASEKLDQVEN